MTNLELASGRFTDTVRPRGTPAMDAYYQHHDILPRHEAGHTVAAWALGLGVQYVAAAGPRGLTQTTLEPDAEEKELMLLLAGMRAERSHVRWFDGLRLRWPGTEDHVLFEKRVARLGLRSTDASHLRTMLASYVDELLNDHSRKLDLVHDALARARVLSGPKLAALLRSS